MFNDGQLYLDHPKIYSAKYHHSMHTDTNNKNKDDCAVLTQDQFRMNDYYYYSGDWLVDGNVVKRKLFLSLPNQKRNGLTSYPKQRNWGTYRPVFGSLTRTRIQTSFGTAIHMMRAIFETSKTCSSKVPWGHLAIVGKMAVFRCSP
jgi:hypothetical protein